MEHSIVYYFNYGIIRIIAVITCKHPQETIDTISLSCLV